jgi:hypothetical protein
VHSVGPELRFPPRMSGICDGIPRNCRNSGRNKHPSHHVLRLLDDDDGAYDT